MAETFAELEPYFAAYLNRLSLAQRRKIFRKIGMELRKANAKRIAANVEPDGSPMQRRRKRKRIKGANGRIRRTKKMFPKIRLTKALRVRPGNEGVELSFVNPIVTKTAAAHQYGLTDFVGKTKAGKVVRTKYPARVLLGFGPEDLDEITDLALKLLEV